MMFMCLAFLFAGNSTAFGQALPGSAPRTLDESCEGSPLNPVPGVSYDYSATVDPAGGSAYWWAQWNLTTFITDGARTADASQEAIDGDFISEAENYRDDNDEDTSPTTTSITWKTGGLAKVSDEAPLFVVLHYTAPADACADNLKVYRIIPLMPFQINVIALRDASADPDNFPQGYGLDQASCFDVVRTAAYDLENNCMTYHYGTNVLAFEVIAAYFDASYEATFRIEGLQDGQTASIFWSYENVAPDFETATPLESGLGNGVVATKPMITTEADDTSEGVSIYVWVVVDNGTYEGLNDTPITFAAAGRTATAFDEDGEPTVWQQNVRWDDCDEIVDITADLTDDEVTNAPDYGVHILNERPTLVGTTETGFEGACGTVEDPVTEP